MWKSNTYSEKVYFVSGFLYLVCYIVFHGFEYQIVANEVASGTRHTVHLRGSSSCNLLRKKKRFMGNVVPYYALFVCNPCYFHFLKIK